MTTASQQTPRRFTGDHGSVMVESAIILPVILVLLAGIVDYGGAFRNRITMQGATRNAGRSAAVLGPAVSADQFTLSTLWAGLSKMSNTTLTKAIIFKTDSNGTLSTSCKNLTPNAASGNGINAGGVSCNVYAPTQVQNAGTTFTQAGTSCAAAGWDHWYCPYTRGNSLTAPAGPDYLGVYVSVNYTPYTRIFATTYTLTDQEVVRLEPVAG